MSNYDQWLERQAGCYDREPSCPKCGYDLCEHGVCASCFGCALCDADEQPEQPTRKRPQPASDRPRRRKAG